MIKAIEKAMFIAETDTRRRKSKPTLQQIESRLMKNILAQSLALEIIRNSQKPSSELISELIDIEAAVGEFVGQALQQSTAKHKNKIDLKGALAGALSFVPFQQLSRRKLTEISPRKMALNWLKKALEEESAKETTRLISQQPPGSQANSFQASHSSSLSSQRKKKANFKTVSSRAPKKPHGKKRSKALRRPVSK